MSNQFYVILTLLIMTLSTSVTYANNEDISKATTLALVKHHQSHSQSTPQFETARYLTKPNFEKITRRVSYPKCHCDEKGNPLEDCQEQILEVRTSMVINTEGVPQDIEIVSSSGNPRFDRNVINVSEDLRFIPFEKEGKPIIGKVIIPFRLVYKPAMEAVCKSRRQSQPINELVKKNSKSIEF